MTEEIELWGTFSVADHFRTNPFVTDVLLYDQLVIPIPAEDALKEEWKRWDKDKQGRLIGELGNLVVPMPWGTQQSQIFKERFKANTRIVQELGYVRNAPPDEQAQYVTRDVLKDYANKELDNQLFRQLKALSKRPDTKVEAVTAYGSPSELKKGLGMERADNPSPDKKEVTPAAVFNWTIHIPDGEDPLEMLKQAVSLAIRSDFREHRSYFYSRLRDLKELQTEAVQKDLKKRLVDYEKIMRGQAWHTKARRATQAMLITPGLLALVEPISATLLGAAVGATAYFVSEHMEPPEADERTRVAAMAYDIKAEFGDRLRPGYDE